MQSPEGAESSVERPAYESPTIVTISESELIEIIGPAQAYAGINIGGGNGHGHGHGPKKH